MCSIILCNTIYYYKVNIQTKPKQKSLTSVSNISSYLFKGELSVVDVWSGHPAFGLVFALLHQILNQAVQKRATRAFLFFLLFFFVLLRLFFTQLVYRGRQQLSLHVRVPGLRHHLLRNLHKPTIQQFIFLFVYLFNRDNTLDIVIQRPPMPHTQGI